MLIATFNDSTAWAGKTIAHDGRQYVLEGSGPITAQQVVGYAEAGQIDWASDGVRAWVYGRAASSPQKETPRRSGRPWVWLLGAAVVVAVVIGGGVAISSLRSPSGQADGDHQGAVGGVTSSAAPAPGQTRAPAPAPAPATASPSGQLVSVYTWAGGGGGGERYQSAPFLLNGGRQIFTVSSQPAAAAGGVSPELHFMIFDASLDRATDRLDPSVGTSSDDFTLSAGSYYIAGYTAGCTWSMTVQEER